MAFFKDEDKKRIGKSRFDPYYEKSDSRLTKETKSKGRGHTSGKTRRDPPDDSNRNRKV